MTIYRVYIYSMFLYFIFIFTVDKIHLNPQTINYILVHQSVDL